MHFLPLFIYVIKKSSIFNLDCPDGGSDKESKPQQMEGTKWNVKNK